LLNNPVTDTFIDQISLDSAAGIFTTRLTRPDERLSENQIIQVASIIQTSDDPLSITPAPLLASGIISDLTLRAESSADQIDRPDVILTKIRLSLKLSQLSLVDLLSAMEAILAEGKKINYLAAGKI
jgi:hypothetical protein